MDRLPEDFLAWRQRFHRRLRLAVEGTPMRFEYRRDSRTLFLKPVIHGVNWDIRAVLSCRQRHGEIFIARRVELVVMTVNPQAAARRVTSVLEEAGALREYPVANIGEGQHVQHTEPSELRWLEMQQFEDSSIGWYLYHIARLDQIFRERL